MDNRSAIWSVIAGLAVGIAFIVIVASIFTAFDQSVSITRNDGVKFTLEGIKSRYPANEAIWFTVTVAGHGKLCSPLAARIVNADDGTAIAYYYKNINCSAVERNINEVWTLHDLMPGSSYFPQLIHPVYGATGHLKIVVEYGGIMLVKDFVQD